VTAHEWTLELLLPRICDLNDVKFTLSGNDYCNYSAPNTEVEALIKNAIHYLEADELDLCTHCCERAELAQVMAIRELCHGA
jgi:hypothetical protein